jgi:hypothetical protein
MVTDVDHLSILRANISEAVHSLHLNTVISMQFAYEEIGLANIRILG